MSKEIDSCRKHAETLHKRKSNITKVSVKRGSRDWVQGKRTWAIISPAYLYLSYPEGRVQ